jgi:chemotaxis-related protein WspD
MSEASRTPRPLDAQTLQQQTDAFARPVETQRKQDVHVVLARIGSSWIAFPAARVLRVTTAVVPHRVPHRRHRALCGLANIEGEIAAVVDFASVCGFDWSAAGGARARMVVLGERGSAWAFEVDEVPGTLAVSAEDLVAAPVTVSTPHAGFTSGLVPTEHGPAGMVDVDALLTACEGVVRT